ncbi:MAG: hypothetical protein OQK12_03850 [Motiliproteus sp.]|nr:hypothetical protein [Motiliproteus sp.]MCW9052996.1 hypothetical protein [Motiliproteus sp.]
MNASLSTTRAGVAVQPIRLYFGKGAVAALFLLVTSLITALPSQAANSPQLKLFPTTVLEDIRHTGDVAKEMESGLQELISRLDQQSQLFTESKCEGAEEDPGCTQLQNQLSDTYLEMLDVMDKNLPEMEKAVDSTRNSLQKRLRRELGQKMTPWDLQETLLGTASQQQDVSRPTMRGRSGMRLSDRFSQYYRLVSTNSSNAQQNASLAVIASDIYLDMEETSDLISRTRQEIARATLMGKLNQSFGVITPEMQDVVAGVKSILFGDSANDLPLAAPPVAASPQGYQSPLEM